MNQFEMNARAAQYANYLDGDHTVASTVSFGTNYAISAGPNPLLNGWIRRIEQKRFPRIESQLEIVWERRLLRFQRKKWDRRKMIVGEVFWKLGIVWGSIGATALTLAMIAAISRWILG